jgi:hypothetical protein
MSSETKLNESFKMLKENYAVNDLIPKDARFLFILESPHKEELKNGVPVAGSSGRMMSKIIFGRETTEPIGLMVSSPIGRVQEATLRKIALLNVSPIPMQDSAYAAADQSSHKDFLTILEKIRVNLSDEYKNPEWNYVRNLIRKDFISRLSALAIKEMVVIPCGKFAHHHYFKSGISNDKWTELQGVPHPSRNQWYQDIPPIARLKKAIKAE